MSSLTTSTTSTTPPPRPALVGDDLAAQVRLLAAAVDRLTEETRALAARLLQAETRLAALTPEQVLAGVSAQIETARANLRENLNWLELSIRMMSKARESFADLSVADDAAAITGALPNPAAALAAALGGPAGHAKPTPAASPDSLEAMLGSLAAQMGLKV